MAKKLGAGDQYIVGPQPVSPGPYGCCAYGFLTAHQHILGYSVPSIHSVLFSVCQIYIKVGYNRGINCKICGHFAL